MACFKRKHGPPDQNISSKQIALMLLEKVVRANGEDFMRTGQNQLQF